MTNNLMTSYGYAPNFDIFATAGAFEAFLDATIAINNNDRPALNAAFHAALAIEDAYIVANTTYRHTGTASVPVYPEHPNLTDFIMNNITTMLLASKAA
jgi:hypothetical protein